MIKEAKSRYIKNIEKLSKKDDWCKIKEVANIMPVKKTASYNIEPNELMRHFNSIKIDDKYHLQHDTSQCQNVVIKLTDNEVLQAINKVKKGGGLPYIHSSLLKQYKHIFLKPLKAIFTVSLNSGIIPHTMKIGKITPVPKINQPKTANDFRPITSLSPIFKVLERLVMDKWLKPLVSIDKLDDQFAFIPLKGRGCTSALTAIYGQAVSRLDQGHYVNLLLIDFSKAFDRTPCSKIIDVLISCGAPIQCIFWIFNFLNQRNCFVEINGSKSELS